MGIFNKEKTSQQVVGRQFNKLFFLVHFLIFFDVNILSSFSVLSKSIVTELIISISKMITDP